MGSDSARVEGGLPQFIYTLLSQVMRLARCKPTMAPIPAANGSNSSRFSFQATFHPKLYKRPSWCRGQCEKDEQPCEPCGPCGHDLLQAADGSNSNCQWLQFRPPRDFSLLLPRLAPTPNFIGKLPEFMVL